MANMPVSIADAGVAGTTATVAGALADGRTPSGAVEAAAYLYGSNGSTQDRLKTAAGVIAGNSTGSILATINYAGSLTSLNITVATNVKASAGRLFKVIVVAPGSTNTVVADSTSASAAATTLLIIPSTAAIGAIYDLNAPCTTGIRVEPGTGAILNVVYQ